MGKLIIQRDRGAVILILESLIGPSLQAAPAKRINADQAQPHQHGQRHHRAKLAARHADNGLRQSFKVSVAEFSNMGMARFRNVGNVRQ